MYSKATSIIACMLVLLLQCFAVNSAFAFQNVEISGTVTDASTGETLPGVNVVLQGTETGTATDLDGLYTLEIPENEMEDGILVFSSVGFQTQEVPIEGRSTVNLSMNVMTLSGGELVVVGYGTQERRQITGSVSSVQEEDFVSGNVQNVSEMIQGKVPGLQVSTATGGNPNSNATIRLRGVNSFGENQEPLVVVDGIIGADLNNIDPNDIASVDVLKDASASAIYGTRGSAGVILVTTKSGQRGAESLSVNYSGHTTFESVENKNEVLSADEYRSFAQETGFEIQDFGANTDWFDEISQNGMSQVHNLAVSGGTENMNYRLSGNYRDRQGIQKYTGFEQLGARLNLTHWSLDQKLKLTGTLAITNRDENLGFGDAFRYALIMNPTAPVTADGFENLGGYFDQNLFDYFSPVNIIETGERLRERKNFTAGFRADYEFRDLIPNLQASLFYSRDNRDQILRNFYSQNNKLQGSATQSALGRGLAQQYYDDEQTELFELTLNYLADLSDRINLEAFVGYSYNEEVNEGFSASGGDFVTDAVEFNNFGFAQDFDAGTGTVESYRNSNKIIGYFSRANINIDDTYFLNASFRREGSSRFGIDNKWGNFWSAGLGIQVSNLIEIGFLDELRVRGSIGKTGNNAPFSGIATQRFGPTGNNFFVNGGFIQAFGPVSNANPDLKWEEKTEINIGVDFEALSSRLRGSAEYYNSVTSDLLFEVGVPVPPNLFGTTWRNVGELENSGLELSVALDALQSTDGLNWTTQFNFTFYGETVLNKFETDEVRYIATAGSPGQNSTDLIRIKEGEPIGQIWGPEFSRIGPDGNWLFLDGDGNEVSFGDLTLEDEKLLGNGLPDYQIGWSNTLNYQNWDLNFFFQGSFGHQLVNLFGLFYQAPRQIASYNILQTAMDIPELTDSPQYSSYYVENADYIRLQNMSVGYTFPMGSNSQISNLRLYVSGNNLFTITGYSGINPEVRHTDENPGILTTGFTTGGALAPGIERRSNWFTTRSINLGINLSF